MNAITLPDRRMTVEEFLRWAETQPGNEKLELVDGWVVPKYGEPVGMVGDTVQHNRCKGAAYRALGDAITRAGLPCDVFVDGVGVSIQNGGLRIPDVLVQCGRQEDDDLALVSTDPMIVVEVLSRSSERTDIGAKLADYFTVSSILHYVILEPARKLAIHHRRQPAGGEIHTSILRDGILTLDPPGVSMLVSDMFGAR